MAKREDSEAAQHETYPGTGPGTGPRKDAQSDSGIHPVEQMVDAAIDRLARQYREREVAHSTVEDESQSVARGSQSPRAAVAREPGSTAIVTEAAAVERRLRWRGLDVSDEFHQYAQRIARGEKLPPYSGQVLAQPDPRFPWQPGGRTTPSRRGRAVLYTLCASSVLVAVGIVWAAALRFENRVRPVQSEVVAAVQVMPKELASPPASDSSERPRTEATAPPAAVAVSGPVNRSPVAEAPPEPPAVPAANVAQQVQQAPPRSYLPRPAPNTSPAPPRNVAPPPGDLRAALGELLRPNGLEAESAATPAATSSAATSAATTSPAAMSPAVAAPVAKSPGATPAVAPPQPAPAPPARADVPAARKEPGSESSAKGSLLVETPSF